MRFLDALAKMNIKDRWGPSMSVMNILELNIAINNYHRQEGREFDSQPFEDAYACIREAFLEPEKAEHKKQLSKVLRKSIPENIKTRLLEKENYFRLISAMTFSMVFYSLSPFVY